MSRLLTLALSATLLACAVCAAPAPLPKPWVTGWDKPVDPLGDCKFHRKGDVLTIEVSGKEHTVWPFSLTAPHLLREVTGDFVAQVRVSGAFEPSSPEALAELRAGLMLMDGRAQLRLERFARSRDGKVYTDCEWAIKRAEGVVIHTRPMHGAPTYFRLEREGESLRGAVSLDGMKWRLLESMKVKLAATLKLGVFAATTSSAPFKPHFDQFKLTLKGR